MKYRIKTKDGHTLRKVATRPYNKALVNREGTIVYAHTMTTGNFKRADLEWFLERGFEVEEVIAEEIRKN